MKVEILHLSVTSSASSKDCEAAVTLTCDTEGVLWLQAQIGKNLAPPGKPMTTAPTVNPSDAHAYGWAALLQTALRATQDATTELASYDGTRETSAREKLLVILDDEGILKK